MPGRQHQSTRQTQANAAGRRGCLFAALLIADGVLFLLAYWLATGGNPRALSVLALVAAVAGIVLFVPVALLIMQDGLGLKDILRGLGRSRGWQVVIGGVLVILLAGLGVAALAGLWSAPAAPAPTPTPAPGALTAVASPAPTGQPPTVSAAPTATPSSAPPTASPPTVPAPVTPATLLTPAATAAPPTFTPLPTDTPLPTETLPPTLALPTLAPPTLAPPTLAPTATPSPSPQPPATATAVPRPEELVAATVLEANEALVGAMLNLARPEDELRIYYCGTSAWRKITAFLTKVAQTRGGAVTATYFFSDTPPPVQELDYRWRLEQTETWTYVGRTGKSTREVLRYTYWLVERPGETPALCIDDYTSKQME